MKLFIIGVYSLTLARVFEPAKFRLAHQTLREAYKLENQEL